MSSKAHELDMDYRRLSKLGISHPESEKLRTRLQRLIDIVDEEMTLRN
ncbi:MAG: hypothetical protein Q8N99_01185 [Nanoarchaeota archaeon]|nr:hypothetical protein [Nanoarchaeota archaeon]